MELVRFLVSYNEVMVVFVNNVVDLIWVVVWCNFESEVDWCEFE